MDPATVKLLAGGGFGAALLYLVMRIGNRLVDSIDRFGVKVDENATKTGDKLGEIHSTLSGLLERDRIRAQTPASGVQIQVPR